MNVEKMIMGITLAVSPFVCVILACAFVYEKVGMNEIWVGLTVQGLYGLFLAVATSLLKYTEIKRGVRDARQSR